ncbi:amino acid ABC transporter permease [bacterium]|nr:amino acid ABC transporter permease [bacterium]
MLKLAKGLRRVLGFLIFDPRLVWLKYLLTVALLGFLLVSNSMKIGYRWQWYRVVRYLIASGENGLSPGILLQGLAVTMKISMISLLLSSLIGLVTAMLKLSDSIVGRWLAGIYIESIRNTPLLIQILVIYFVFAPIFGISAFASAVIALSLFEGAYTSEIIRGGIKAVSKGQREAAASLGMSGLQTYAFVILPQAFRMMTPPLTGQGISLIKDSALVSVIALYDLTMQGQAIVSETFLAFEIWLTVAALYLSLTLTLSALVRLLEKKAVI